MTLTTAIARFRKYAYRRAKYHLISPQVPEVSEVLQGKTAIVIGSAPFSSRPAGWNESFRVITVNASQIAAAGWLDQRPDITLMQFNQVEGTNASAREVRRVLENQRTGKLIVLHWRHDLRRLEQGLGRFGYQYDDLTVMSRYERIALMRKITGKLNLELEAETKWSNGIVGAALAIASGAESVILTGINPLSTGHAYNDLGHSRLHTAMDMDALRGFLARGYPIFTADRHVAEKTGLPFWSGQT